MFESKRKVAIVVDSFTWHGREILSGIGDYARKDERWITEYVEYSLEAEPPAWLSSWRGDGLVVRDKLGKCFKAAPPGVPVVDLSVARLPGVPTVVSDHPGSVRVGLAHLRERGYSRFAFVGVSGMSFSQDRLDAFVEQTGETRNVFVLESFNLTVYPWKMNRSNLENWLFDLPKPIGLFAAFDPIGVYVLEACAARKISVPDAIGVIGVNNDEVQCKLARPSLSSVVVDSRRLGYRACLLLDELMDGAPAPKRPPTIPVLGVVGRRSTDVLRYSDPLVVQAIRFIRENAVLGIGVEQIAVRFGCSARTLERRFRQETGFSPLDEITRTRLRFAADLLRHSDLIVEAVASRCGFDSSSYFSKLFKEKTGLSPGEFRKTHAASLDSEIERIF